MRESKRWQQDRFGSVTSAQVKGVGAWVEPICKVSRIAPSTYEPMPPGSLMQQAYQHGRIGMKREVLRVLKENFPDYGCARSGYG